MHGHKLPKDRFLLPASFFLRYSFASFYLCVCGGAGVEQTHNPKSTMDKLIAKDVSYLPDISVSAGRENTSTKVVVKHYRTEAVPGTDTSFACLLPEGRRNCPVILFMHGYGGSSDAHIPQAAQLAAKGYVVVLPDREGDDRHGFFPGIFTFMMFATPLSQVSVSGETLLLALEYVEAATACSGGPLSGGVVDTSTIIACGFSMGGVEAINFAATKKEKVKALVLISPSIMNFGTVSWRISQAGLRETAKTIEVPTLIVTSDNDMAAVSAFSYHESVFPDSTLVSIKTTSLDLDCPNTCKSSWSPFLGNVPGKAMGLNDHFALACEEGPTYMAVVTFLENVIDTGKAGDLGIAEEDWVAKNEMTYSKAFQVMFG